MIAKLEKEMAGEADQHAWCTSENKKTAQSLQLKSDKLDEMKTRFEQATSNKQQLLDQVKQLEGELRDMDKSQKTAMELRSKEHAAFLVSQKDLSNAQTACATAIKVLKEYYGAQASSSDDAASLMQMDTAALASQPAGSAASSIIGMLEVAEADFSRNLAEATTTEDQKVNEYETSSDDNKVSKAAKDADIRNKTSEIKRLESLINETQMDVNDATSEKAAVEAYKLKLKKNCETKAPSYEERQKRRQEEMDGMKNALDILNGNGVALVQESEAGRVDELLSGFH
jgi:predicted nuclease with TOPRIM domain